MPRSRCLPWAAPDAVEEEEEGGEERERASPAEGNEEGEKGVVRKQYRQEKVKACVQ